MSEKFAVLAISLIGFAFCANSSANTPLPQESLNEISVVSETEQKPAVIQKNHKTIQHEMIRDVRDLVRYTADVGISDNGRFLKGFSMRGVEGNRVGISIDGVNLPDSEENTLYARYGNFNASRLSIDTELVKNIDIVRGADSFRSGSGALGGTVNYQTLEASDLVKAGKRFGALLRTGYASKNSEWVRTLGAAYTGEKFDAIFLYSQRTGHEMKSNGHGPETQSSSSQHPDPSTHRFHSYLAKFGYQINERHRIGLGVNGQIGNRYTDERSYALFGSQWREADDETKRINANLHYIYTPLSDYIAFFKADWDYQKTDLAAVNYKGGLHWQTKEKQLDEIFDRRMKTEFKRFTLSSESLPLSFLGGEHIFSANTAVSEREFKNINHDTNRFGLDSRYTIQRPVKTVQYHIGLKDDATWSPVFASGWSPIFAAHLGLGYDYIQVKPQALNAQCSNACLAEGEPKSNRFSNFSFLLGTDVQFNPTWQAGYQLASGYRVPTASEMYFTFTNAYGTWKSNPNLTSERSLNHTLFIRAQNDLGRLELNLYHSRYKDFLFEQESIIEQTLYGRTYQTPMQQSVNLDRAHINGLELNGDVHLNRLTTLIPSGFKLYGALGYSKGKLSNAASLLSIQPLKAVIGLDYLEPNGKWGIFSRLTYLGGKKAKDARTFENKTRCLVWEFDAWFGQDICMKEELYQTIETYKYLNKSAYVFDLFGFYHLTDDITLRAGVYNLFNRQYHTWDALRGINAHSTTNSVDRNGVGLARFYAPGRNYSASLEIRF
ncbi:TonB-dependent hemoglobin/transferrin/lactoferrin family receptor [Caviibacterium pharyngocola]|uniref:TonB-dependent hemoglobin/transferrin/lactoferrin family receptor n=1 Tax=Caviibacterium pharyngocola TaxID=28159 RepID=A0A2M8RTR4_9PAST|nr:TonB-dependent hemoglobin/transferrin/lactoferrin family receptor [Caviibacterium pharyngocola]PJG82279.1 TonB-dependent hemoglobin/transferrin/lactoferrin family receptor [Caviibacterium pharyngocola]